jgi:phosphoglycerate dehydrogenase-like enzyme
MTMQCAVLDDYQNAARTFADWSAVEEKVKLQVFDGHIFDRAALVRELIDFEIVVAMRERTAFDAETLAKLPHLQLLVTTGMRNAAIDLDAAAARGITVCGTEATPHPTAELAWGLILALARKIPAEFAGFQHGGRWQHSVGVDLRGRTLGVLGLGRLGGRVARVGKAFEMKVLAWSRHLTRERCAEVGAELTPSFDDLLRASDFVSIHQVLSDRTRGMIGARELGLMKPTAFLINTSRGPIVNEAALIEALRQRKIAGAGLDVFDQEPLPGDHPLRRLDNVVATPHLGYVSEDTYKVFFGQAVEDILAWLDGKPVRVINPVK